MSEQIIQEKNKNLSNRFASKAGIRDLYPLFGLAAIILVFAFLTNWRIVMPASINLILQQVYVLMIASAGVFLIMTVGGLDFSQGSILGMSSIVISYLSFYNIPLGVVAGIAVGAGIGAFNGLFHVKFKIASFIVTICTMFLFRGLCAYMTTDAPVAAVTGITDLNQPWFQLLCTAIVLLVVFLAFHFTRFGISLKAIGAGETAARFSGIRTNFSKFMVFVLAGGITGFAAFLNVIKVGSITATAGNQLETQILIALVLGGMPISGGAKVRFFNIIIGTLIYCILNNGLVMLGFDSAVQQLIKGIIFVIVVTLTIDRKALKVIK